MAEPVYDSDLHLNVMWLDKYGRILSASLSYLSGGGWCWCLSNGDVQERHKATRKKGCLIM